VTVLEDRLVSSQRSRRDVEYYLTDLLEKTRSTCVVVIDKNGLFLHGVGNLEIVDTTALAALVAGSYAATLELVRLLGEDRISILFQQGDKWSIQVSLVGEEAMMVIIFRDEASIGLVRLHANKITQHIIPLLTDTYEERYEESGEPRQPIDLEKFKEYATNLIDKILKD
jgi:predicted regulator of Ras-like GTPase activity (Roadblock/LC7/MglB family)